MINGGLHSVCRRGDVVGCGVGAHTDVIPVLDGYIVSRLGVMPVMETYSGAISCLPAGSCHFVLSLAMARVEGMLYIALVFVINLALLSF